MTLGACPNVDSSFILALIAKVSRRTCAVALGSLNLNDIVWLRSYEGMNRFNLLKLDKVSVFRDECLCNAIKQNPVAFASQS